LLLFEIAYLLLLLVISVFGVHRAVLAIEVALRSRRTDRGAERRARDGTSASGAGEAGGSALSLAPVLIQLPVYNDAPVLHRLLASVSRWEVEPTQVRIQVLDDSDDGSSEGIASRIDALRAEGWRVEHRRRERRDGYKAGALAAGLEGATEPFVAIFDSDFVVPPDFFRALLPDFRDPGLAYVQARWGFANAEENLLTRVQALILDAHFRIEHRVRSQGGRFFNFNGTAGIWRRSAIEDAGGWKSSSITEDLDLSLRAWLRGWRMRLRDDVVVPCDLPTDLRAYRIQQNRWVSGSIQTCASLHERICASPHPWTHRLDALLACSGNLVYPLILLLLLTLPHAIAIRLVERDRLLLHADLPFFLCATLSVGLFYWCASARGGMLDRLRRILALMALGLGMTLHNARAVLRGLSGQARIFERTPKQGGEGPTRGGGDRLLWLEGLLILHLVALPLHAPQVALHALPLLLLFLPGAGWVLFGSIPPRRRRSGA
jgi:cellulose synthase/poly-beta-1,6-N-acetylglucosamine synthase-like glycosyltransferase